MGEVWRGTHRLQDVPVAVKFVTTTAGRVEHYRRMFAHEVRAVARLDHPGIIRVHDHGLVPPDVEVATGGRLPAGAPYLVMDWLGRGPLRNRRGRLAWPTLRAVLLGLLDALAHAHARGIVHRDFKDANVLIGPRGPVITDFGLAIDPTLADSVNDRRIAGTPYYMAPELVRADWRSLGPWTDLYAVGCVAFALATGSPPFAGGAPTEVMRNQLKSPRPRMLPVYPTPEGFEQWVHRMMSRSVRRRFRFAADAAYALASLGTPSAATFGAPDPELFDSVEPSLGSSPTGSMAAVSTGTYTSMPTGPLPRMLTGALPEPIKRPPTGSLPSLSGSFDGTADPHDSVELLSGLASAEATVLQPPSFVPVDDETWTQGGAAVRRIRPPMPASWRRPVPFDQAPPPLLGTGRALAAMREPVLQGRTDERGILWRALRRVIDERMVGAVVIEGAAGSGKSRLARWLGYRAHELGLAEVLVARHSPQPEPGAGLSAMLRRVLRCEGLAGLPRTRRIRRTLRMGRDDPRAIVVAAALEADGTYADGEHRVTLADERERFGAMVTAIADLGRERAVVMLVDDAQWAEQALAFVEFVHRFAPTLPMLFLLTVRDDAVAARPAASLETIAALPQTERLGLGPLDHRSMQQLVASWLPLDGRTLETVTRRAAGSPLFAAELVQHWVRSGALWAASDGFRVRSGAARSMPDGLAELWNARLTDALAGAEGWAAEALEAAAVLGNSVSPVEWESICERARLPQPDGALDRLADARLIHRQRDGRWAFAHAMLREVLLRRIRAAGSWVRWNALAAEVISERPAPDPVRLAGYLVESERPDAAAPLLLDAARRGWMRSLDRRTRALLMVAADALRRAGFRPDDPPWTELRALWSMVGRGQGGRARAHARRAAAAADHVSPRVRAWALFARGYAETTHIEPAVAFDRFVAAYLAADEAGEVFLALRCLRWQSILCARAGELGRAEQALDAADALLEAHPDPIEEAYLLARRVELASIRGQHALADRLALDARARFEAEGHRAGLGLMARQLGDIARNRGDVLEAERWLHQARGLWVELGRQQAVRLIDLNLGLVLVGLGRYDDARERLTTARGDADDTLYATYAALLMLSCDAAAEDWPSWDAHWALLDPLLDGQVVEPDVAAGARIAARVAAAAGDDRRSRDAWHLAMTQFERLGRTAEVEALRAERTFTPTAPLAPIAPRRRS